MRAPLVCGWAALWLLSSTCSHGDQASVPSGHWTGTWHRIAPHDAVPAELRIDGTPPELHFSLESRLTDRVGALADSLVPRGGDASYRNDSGCRIDFSLSGTRLRLRQHGGEQACRLGSGVDFSGDYVPGKLPSIDLLSLHVVDSAAQDRAARTLLGQDYQAMVEAVDLASAGRDLDGTGAIVQSYLVRLRDVPASAIVMRHDAQLWIGLLVEIAGKPHLRYYSNVPTWKKRVPQTILAWRDGIDPALPIDPMP